ncbi:DNA-3-methyladenine glycosylase [Candidatus Curtissbacteria bacterium]|nr:DNA-3-methyladenine glycosylase [Candidatus Curtissbacteria bacterium]
MKILKKGFFARPTLIVAQELVGKYLVKEGSSGQIARMITEVEAYLGPEDLASHARFGITKRNQVMWGSAGVFYVYFNYGVHWMLNIVAGKVDEPGAILIRGVEGISGPGRLTKFFGIDKTFYGKPAEKTTGLWFEQSASENNFKIAASKRIGVSYAGSWSLKRFRFSLVV